MKTSKELPSILLGGHFFVDTFRYTNKKRGVYCMIHIRLYEMLNDIPKSTKPPVSGQPLGIHRSKHDYIFNRVKTKIYTVVSSHCRHNTRSIQLLKKN